MSPTRNTPLFLRYTFSTSSKSLSQGPFPTCSRAAKLGFADELLEGGFHHIGFHTRGVNYSFVSSGDTNMTDAISGVIMVVINPTGYEHHITSNKFVETDYFTKLALLNG